MNDSTVTPSDLPAESLSFSTAFHTIRAKTAKGTNNTSVSQRFCAQARRKNA
jgi:hypothetical protein